MKISINIKKNTILGFFDGISPEFLLFVFATIVSVYATLFMLANDYVTTYGDAESHLNIAKRVVHSITPGFAQLGGIWLPLPHLLMVPFVYFDPLWRSGLAGAIISGLAYIVTGLYLYKLTFMLTRSKLGGVVASIVFLLNPNVMYLQSTPMTELTLLAFFTLSTYYFIKFIRKENELVSLLLAAFFGFCATLSRYDGWFLVAIEALTIVLLYARNKRQWQILKGKVLLFSTLAFFGIALWFVWDLLILGDPLYFTNSQYSAKTQQMAWLSKGELPAYHNIVLSFLYYAITAMSNSGVIIFLTACVGLFYYLKNPKEAHRLLVALVLLVPFIFNVLTLFIGQSVIFIPSLTPKNFEWHLFNVRYGVMMVPISALFVGYCFTKVKFGSQFLLVGLFVCQCMLYIIGYSKVISLEDGRNGLSQSKKIDAQDWIDKNYDSGLVLIDDYARTLSVIRTQIPMQHIIYVGNKPYWEDSMKEPEKYATWIIIQRDDALYKAIYEKEETRNRLFTYFNKVYTSPEVVIFKKMDAPNTAMHVSQP